MLTLEFSPSNLARPQAMWNEMQAIVMDDPLQISLYTGAFIHISPKWMSGFTRPRAVYQPTLWIECWKPG